MSDSMSDGDKRLSPGKAADVAGVSRGTIQNAIKSSKLKAFRSNKGWLIEPDDLQEWLSGREPEHVPASMLVDMPVPANADTEALMTARLENAEMRGKMEAQERLIGRLEAELEYAKRPMWKRLFG